MLYYLYRPLKEYNLNNTYYQTLDENFNKAIELYENSIPHEELISLLENGNIVQKQIATLKLDTINSEQDTRILISNLVGQDGKIREAVSFKLQEFMQNQSVHKFFLQKSYADIFLEAIIDINGNICRNTISAICNLRPYPEFTDYFCQKLTTQTLHLISKVEQFDFQDGKYKVNKEVFKLYWCLETISRFTNYINPDILKEILKQTKNIGEYTIREKTAKILSKIVCDSELAQIKQELKQDKNYYVRRF